MHLQHSITLHKLKCIGRAGHVYINVRGKHVFIAVIDVFAALMFGLMFLQHSATRKVADSS